MQIGKRLCRFIQVDEILEQKPEQFGMRFVPLEGFAGNFNHEHAHRSPPKIKRNASINVQRLDFLEPRQILVVPMVGDYFHRRHDLQQPGAHPRLLRAHAADEVAAQPFFLGENVGDDAGLRVFFGFENDTCGFDEHENQEIREIGN